MVLQKDIDSQSLLFAKQEVNEKNYCKALKIINNKGLINASKLPNKFGWKKSDYIDYILNLLDKSSEMIDAMKKYIEIDKE